MHALRRDRLVLRVRDHGRRDQQDLLALFNPFGDDAIVDVSIPHRHRGAGARRVAGAWWCRAGHASPSRSRTPSCASNASPCTCTRARAHRRRALGDLRRLRRPTPIPPARASRSRSGPNRPPSPGPFPRARPPTAGSRSSPSPTSRTSTHGSTSGVVVVGEPTLGPETIRVPARVGRGDRRDRAGPARHRVRDHRDRGRSPMVGACRSSPSCSRRGRRRRRAPGWRA